MTKNHLLRREPHQRDVRRRAGVAIAAASFALAGVLSFVGAPSASAVGGPPPYDNPNYNTDGAHSYAAEDPFNPNCPNAIVDTPGSFPANKELTGSNTFAPGSDVHYVYHDNSDAAHPNFEIQDCMATYPADFFSASSFSAGGALIDDSYSKQDLDAGTKIDAVELTGIVPADGDITFKWTVPADIEAGVWVCNFARDVSTGHAGEGNRKALPVCGQVPAAPITPRTPTVTAVTTCGVKDTLTIPATAHVIYSYDGTDKAAGVYTDFVTAGPHTVTARAASGYTLATPPNEAESWSWPLTGSAVETCSEATRVTAVNPSVSTACGRNDLVVIPTTTGVTYSYKIDNGAVTAATAGQQVSVAQGSTITVTAAAASASFTLTNPSFSYQYTGTAVVACSQIIIIEPTTTTTTTEAPTTTTAAPTTTTSLPELPFTPEPEVVTTTTMAPAPELAFTGSNTGYLTMMGLVLVGFGGLLFAGTSRKRRTDNS